MTLPPLLAAGLTAAALAVSGALLTEIGPWYRALRKPRWQPPDWAFGPVWNVILALWACSAALAWEASAPSGNRTAVFALFGVNAVLFFGWTPLFFKLRRPDWALAEVSLFWLSIAALILELVPLSPLASGLLIPYLLWVSFATRLNLEIVRLNGPFSSRTPREPARTGPSRPGPPP